MRQQAELENHALAAPLPGATVIYSLHSPNLTGDTERN